MQNKTKKNEVEEGRDMAGQISLESDDDARFFGGFCEKGRGKDLSQTRKE